MFPAINGAGVNIAIIDSGIDNLGPIPQPNQHRSLPWVRYRGGLDVSSTTSWQDANDSTGHGTLVASIALGQATPGWVTPTGFPLRGMAPGAGYFDVKITSGPIIAPWRLWKAAQWVYYMRANKGANGQPLWKVDVMLMSLTENVPSSGMEALPLLMDVASSFGIAVVAPAGDLGQTPAGLPANDITSPGSASRAITVGACNDRNTFIQIWPNTSRGPRANDGDGDPYDELKPDVVAPGVTITGAAFNSATGITTDTGTSLATAHVAGLTACIIQQRPGINPASIKQQLWYSATPFVFGVWNPQWGRGGIQAFRALDFANSANLNLAQAYSSPLGACGWVAEQNLVLDSSPRFNVPNRVTVKVRNTGPGSAPLVMVNLGAIYLGIFSPTYRVWDDVAAQEFGSPLGSCQTRSAQLPWTPRRTGAHSLRAELGFADDPNYFYNVTWRDYGVQNSPVTFRVENYLTREPRRIRLVPTLVYTNDQPEQVVIQPRELFLSGSDCPAEVNAQIIRPANAPPGWRQTANIEAFLETDNAVVSLGSIPIEAGDRPHDVSIASMDRAANTLKLSWDAGTLQQAARVTGPWETVSGATPPFTVQTTGAARFFRVFETNWCSLTLTKQPPHTVAAPGEPVTFTVEAWALEGPFTYQWQENRGANIGWSDIPGATASTYTVPAVTSADDGAVFRVLVSNSCKTTVSDAAKLSIGCSAPTAAE
jgi:hypothetical protein